MVVVRGEIRNAPARAGLECVCVFGQDGFDCPSARRAGVYSSVRGVTVIEWRARTVFRPRATGICLSRCLRIGEKDIVEPLLQESGRYGEAIIAPSGLEAQLTDHRAVQGELDPERRRVEESSSAKFEPEIPRLRDGQNEPRATARERRPASDGPRATARERRPASDGRLCRPPSPVRASHPPRARRGAGAWPPSRGEARQSSRTSIRPCRSIPKRSNRARTNGRVIPLDELSYRPRRARHEAIVDDELRRLLGVAQKLLEWTPIGVLEHQEHLAM